MHQVPTSEDPNAQEVAALMTDPDFVQGLYSGNISAYSVSNNFTWNPNNLCSCISELLTDLHEGKATGTSPAWAAGWIAGLIAASQSTK
jgi:hypothetical protein